MLYLTRVYEFSASHRLYNPELSKKENEDLFGMCARDNGHGHNYVLEVTVKGEVDEKTGMIIDIDMLDRAVETHLVDQVDHFDLNKDVDFLEGILPSAENLVVVFWGQVEPFVPSPAKLHRIRLQETRNNWAEYLGD